MIKWGHMNVCTSYFLFEAQSIKCFFFNFLLNSSFMAPSPNMENEQSLIEQTWRSTQERRSLEQTNQWLTITIQWKLNKQRCNCERMRDKDIKFIHIISIMIFVYSNDINLKILISHWRHLTTTFKLLQASYRVLLDDIRTYERFSSSNLSQPTSIRLCTLSFRVIQCSMECLRTPPW